MHRDHASQRLQHPLPVTGGQFPVAGEFLPFTVVARQDAHHRLTGVTSQTGPVLAASGYTLDASGRRARTVLADGTWWKYTYDDHGQVTNAERRRTAGAAPDDSDPAIPGQQFGYAYDGLGNRTAATQGGGGIMTDAALTYTPTASNQYTALAHNRTGIVTGVADPAAYVSVNGSAAPRSHLARHPKNALCLLTNQRNP